MLRPYYALPSSLVIASMIGMMILFMREGDTLPAIVPLLLLLSLSTVVNSGILELKRRDDSHEIHFPGWVLPFAGTVGGLAICAQLAIYLANHLQENPVPWFLHVPGLAALVAILGVLHVAWRD